MSYEIESGSSKRNGGKASRTGDAHSEGGLYGVPGRARPPLEDKAKAVSALLASKRAAFDRPSERPRISLPDISRSPGEVSRRLNARTGSQAKLELPRTSLDAPPVRLPEDGPVADRTRVDAPSSEMPGIAPQRSSPETSPVGDGVGSPAVGDRPQSMPASAKSNAGAASPSTLISARANASSPGFSQPGLVNDPRQRPTGTGDGIDPRPGPIRGGAAVEAPSSLVSSRTVNVDLPREPDGASHSSGPQRSTDEPGNGAGRVGHGMMGDRPQAVDRRSESSTIFVRNPLSADLRNASMASPDFPESGGGQAGQGGPGKGPDQNVLTAMTASQGGPSIDLSKTNELLQQLIDAVRKQRPSSLPIGGPSAYPDR